MQIHSCHSNEMLRKDRRRLNSRTHSPSQLASGDGGWRGFDDSLCLRWPRACAAWTDDARVQIKGCCYQTAAPVLNCGSLQTDGGKWRNKKAWPGWNDTEGSSISVFGDSLTSD